MSPRVSLCPFVEVLFVAGDLDVSSDEAVGDLSAAVWRPPDAILYLCVADGCVVGDACVGANLAVVA
jgi:hypothetical protein